MMDEAVLIEEKDAFLERLYFSGVSTGKLEIHYEDGKYIVLKERGHQAWGLWAIILTSKPASSYA